jgi:hypothetical protein
VGKEKREKRDCARWKTWGDPEKEKRRVVVDWSKRHSWICARASFMYS